VAASPENQLIKRRWCDVNGLRKPDRAPVWCRPAAALYELLPWASLRCRDPKLRPIEHHLRHILLKRDIGDDFPVDPFYPAHAVFDCDPSNIWGVDVRRRQPEQPTGAWAFDPPLKSEADYDRLELPRYRYHKEESDRALAWTHDLLGEILPVRLVCGAPLSSNLGYYAADLRGLTQMTLDMVDAPQLLHRLMAHLRDGVLGAMRQVSETGLLTPNNTGPMTCSDPVGAPRADGSYAYSNLWGRANSQEFDQVSPAMWEEFCLSYQRPILEEFGLVQYGCCENLTHKIDGVLSIPNLRVFVCSAWTNLEKVIERVGDRHVIMWRQKASAVVFPDDTSDIRRHLQEGARRLRGCHFQIVLRELETLAGHRDRLHAWTRLAKEAAAT